MRNIRFVTPVSLLSAGAILFSTPLVAQGNANTPAQLTEAQYLALGQKYTEWFLTGLADSLMAHMPPEDRTPDQAEQCLRRRDFLAVQSGYEVLLLEEKMNRRRGRPQYWREAKYDQFSAEPIVLRWVFDEQGRIKGLGLGPKSQAPAPD